MRFWLSGEVMADVSQGYREARNDVEDYFNDALASNEYGRGLQTLAFIGILRPDDHPDYPEVHRYHKRLAKAEFRLRIDYEAFRIADAHRARALICEAIARAIQLLPNITKGIDSERFLADFRYAARTRDWILT